MCKYNPAQCCVGVVLPGSFVLIFQFHSGLHLAMLYVDELCKRDERGTEQPFPLHPSLVARLLFEVCLKCRIERVTLTTERES